jgi:hypothetical protein
MDLKELDVISSANEGFELRLVNPKTQENLGLYITVLGKDSDAFRRLSAEQNRRRLTKMTKGGVVRFGTLSAEELDADAVDLLAACTVRWREDEGVAAPKDTLTINGDEVPCTRANAVSVYTRFPWIREQVDTAIGDRANFIKG